MRHARSTNRAAVDQLAFVFTEAAPTSRSVQERAEAPPLKETPIPMMPPRAVAARKPTARAKTLRREGVQTVAHEDRRLTVEEAADVLSVSVKTLEAWRRLGKGPVFVKLGRSVRYTMPALDAFTRARTVRNSAEGRLLDARR